MTEDWNDGRLEVMRRLFILHFSIVPPFLNRISPRKWQHRWIYFDSTLKKKLLRRLYQNLLFVRVRQELGVLADDIDGSGH